MTTVNEQLTAINKEQNTLNLILQMIAVIDPQKIYIVHSSDAEYDSTRIDAIRSYLETERDAVQAEIEDLFDDCVSGC